MFLGVIDPIGTNPCSRFNVTDMSVSVKHVDIVGVALLEDDIERSCNRSRAPEDWIGFGAGLGSCLDVVKLALKLT